MYNEGDYNGALEILRRINEINPGYPVIADLLAETSSKAASQTPAPSATASEKPIAGTMEDDPADPDASDSGGFSMMIIIVVIIAAAAAVVIVLLITRKKKGPPTAGPGPVPPPASTPPTSGTSSGGPENLTQAQVAAVCPNCGKPILKDAKFCRNCGTQIETHCANCGEKLKPGAQFCSSCGQKSGYK